MSFWNDSILRAAGVFKGAAPGERAKLFSLPGREPRTHRSPLRSSLLIGRSFGYGAGPQGSDGIGRRRSWRKPVVKRLRGQEWTAVQDRNVAVASCASRRGKALRVFRFFSGPHGEHLALGIRTFREGVPKEYPFLLRTGESICKDIPIPVHFCGYEFPLGAFPESLG